MFSVSRPPSQSPHPGLLKWQEETQASLACWTVVVLVFGSPGLALGQSPADACPDYPRTRAVSGPHYQHLSFAKNPVEEALKSPEMPGFDASEDASQPLSPALIHHCAVTLEF